MKFQTFFVLCLLAITGVGIDQGLTTRRDQRAAAAAGVAEYALNPKTGRIEFRFKTVAAATPTPTATTAGPSVTPNPEIVGPTQ